MCSDGVVLEESYALTMMNVKWLASHECVRASLSTTGRPWDNLAWEVVCGVCIVGISSQDGRTSRVSLIAVAAMSKL